MTWLDMSPEVHRAGAPVDLVLGRATGLGSSQAKVISAPHFNFVALKLRVSTSFASISISNLFCQQLESTLLAFVAQASPGPWVECLRFRASASAVCYFSATISEANAPPY